MIFDYNRALKITTMLATKQAIKHYSNNRTICDYVFNKYLNNRILQGEINERHRVYDQYGMIDTLGHAYSKGINHFSFSNEGGCMFGIKVNSKWFVYVDFDCKEVYIFDKYPLDLY